MRSSFIFVQWKCYVNVTNLKQLLAKNVYPVILYARFFSVNRPVLFLPPYIGIFPAHLLSSEIIRFIDGNFSFSVRFDKLTVFFTISSFFVNIQVQEVIGSNPGSKYFSTYSHTLFGTKNTQYIGGKISVYWPKRKPKTVYTRACHNQNIT